MPDYGFPKTLTVRPTRNDGVRLTKGVWSSRSWSQVSGGLSNTWLYFEAAGDRVVYQGRPATHERGAWPSNVPTDIEAFVRTDDGQHWIEHHEKGPDHPFYTGLQLNRTNYSGIYSFHPGGANTSNCDGATRFISEGADLAVLESLFSRTFSEQH